MGLAKMALISCLEFSLDIDGSINGDPFGALFIVGLCRIQGNFKAIEASMGLSANGA